MRRWALPLAALLLASGCTNAEYIHYVWQSRGATPQEADAAVMIAACESGGHDPARIDAASDPSHGGSGSLGAFQILWPLHADMGYSRAELLTLGPNVDVAWRLWVGAGRRWNPTWTCRP